MLGIAAAGPLERTARELDRLRHLAAFRREREGQWRRRLRQSDLLLDLVEQCRLRRLHLVPGDVWAHVVRLIGEIDPGLRDELGINRRPDHVSDVLFAAQAVMLAASIEERTPRVAPIIELFGPRSGSS